MSLLLHELSTNAYKYGALSVPQGHISLIWSKDGEGSDAGLTMRWEERGGPPAVEPDRRGFGSRIMRMGRFRGIGTTFHYGAQGLTAEMTATAAQLSLSEISSCAVAGEKIATKSPKVPAVMG